jgi:sulfate permease, SulP family
MSISSTGAMSIIVGSLIANYQGDSQINALVTVVLVVGIVQLAAGLLRLGFLTRFVSTAVMTGFFNGICILVALSQLSNLTGYQSEYSNRIVQAIIVLGLLVAIRIILSWSLLVEINNRWPWQQKTKTTP